MGRPTMHAVLQAFTTHLSRSCLHLADVSVVAGTALVSFRHVSEGSGPSASLPTMASIFLFTPSSPDLTPLLLLLPTTHTRCVRRTVLQSTDGMVVSWGAQEAYHDDPHAIRGLTR